jgi:hypothetical protein
LHSIRVGMSRLFSWPNLTRSSVDALLLTTLVAGAVVSPSAFAQGGPPFQSDDPDTPGDKQWEINVGFKGDRSLSEGSYAVPNIDVNYGLGDRIQLKYELPLAVQEVRGGSSRTVSGLGNSLLGLKYRFYEHQLRTQAGNREVDFAFSIYPQLVLSNPTNSVERGVVEPGPQFLLPFEARAWIGPIHVSAEIGYSFTKKNVSNSWIRGLIVGHEFERKGGLYLELFDQPNVGGLNPKLRESTLGIGGRRAIIEPRNGSVLFIGMAGRSLTNTTFTNNQPSWIAYVGVQFLLE